MIAPELWREAFTHRTLLWRLLGLHLAATATHIPAAVALATALTGVARREPVPIAVGVAVVAASAAVRYTLTVAESRAAATLGDRVAVAVRDRALSGALTAARLHDAGSRDGETLSVLTDGVDGIDTYITRYLPAAVTAAVICPVVTVALAFADVAAAAVVAAATVLAVAGPLLWKRATRSRGLAHWDSYEALAADLLEALRGMKTVRILGGVPAVRARLRRRSDDLHRATVSAMRTSLADTAVVDLAVQGGIVIATSLAVIGYQGGGHAGPASGGLALYVVLLLASEAFRPIRDLARQWHAGYLGMSALPALTALGGFGRRCRPDPTPAPAIRPPHDGEVALTVRALGFRYPETEQDVFTGVNGTFAPGRLVVLTGDSGAGKSTLFDVLLGHLPPTTGSVTFRGRAPRPNDIAVVSQRPVLFAGTVRANLAVAAPDATDDQILAACGAAGALDVVRTLPLGLDTPIAEAGSSLSGGQRQRIALARALLSNRAIILADEPTSALDDRNAVLTFAALRNAARTRIVVVITHRGDAVEPDDRPFALRDGTLVELAPAQVAS